MPKTRKQLTQHFTVEEFDCNDGTPVDNRYHPALIELCKDFLEPMRDKFGPCTVLSGFRTESWNRKIRGALHSMHVYTQRKQRAGVAADVRFARGNPRDWWNEAVRLRQKHRNGNGGIGVYIHSDFIHIDTRDYPANWEG